MLFLLLQEMFKTLDTLMITRSALNIRNSFHEHLKSHQLTLSLSRILYPTMATTKDTALQDTGYHKHVKQLQTCGETAFYSWISINSLLIIQLII